MFDDHDADESTDGDSTEYKRSTFQYGAEPWKDPAVLSQLYHDEKLSQYEIADKFDISQPTVSEWMNKLNVESRPPMDKREAKGVHRNVRRDGYAQWDVADGEGESAHFYEHQIVALSVFSVSEVFASDTVIHHEMNAPVPIDLPENLDVIGGREHAHIHGGGYDPAVEETLAAIFAECGSVEMGDAEDSNETENGTAAN